MFFNRNAIAVAAIILCSTPALPETVSTQNGSDTFLAGSSLNETIDTPRDTFVAARNVVTRGAAQGDLHVTGLDVSVGADTSEDLYAFGGTVIVRGAVGEDLTAGGFSVRTESSADTNGNARLFGNTVTIDGPVNGALSVTAQDVVLNAAIGGDARIVARTISFGPNATIRGKLTYSTENEIAVPERVASPQQVVFERISRSAIWDEFGKIPEDMPIYPTFATVLFGFLVSLLFFMALGAVMLGFMPKRLERMRQQIADSPGRSVLMGVIGLSILFGLVPITAMTIIGLPFVPIAVLFIVIAWTLGYALGAYSVALRIWNGFGGTAEPGNIVKLLVFAAAITFIALLNFIPFVGWVVNFTLVLLGVGAMANAIFLAVFGNPSWALDADMKPIEE